MINKYPLQMLAMFCVCVFYLDAAMMEALRPP